VFQVRSTVESRDGWLRGLCWSGFALQPCDCLIEPTGKGRDLSAWCVSSFIKTWRGGSHGPQGRVAGSVRLKDLLGPATRVKKKKKKVHWCKARHKTNPVRDGGPSAVGSFRSFRFFEHPLGGHRKLFCRKAMLPFGSHQAPLYKGAWVWCR